jgi:hypothetical protein
MRRLLGLVLLTAACACAQASSYLESEPTGWKDIMPGPALEGWTRLPFMSAAPMDSVSQWKMDAASHILLCEGNRGHEWLRYDKELGDAILHAEFRFTKIEGGRGYNSGVMLRNSADGATYFQAQAGEEGTGWLFGSSMVAGQMQRFNMRADMKENRVKPAGEWNVFEMRAEGPRMIVWVNGGVTSQKDDLTVLRGYAGLEAEGYRIEFRNVKLKELTAGSR